MLQPASTFSDSKRHYEILDGLRGVAAVTVVIFHIFETFTGGDHVVQFINHGYMAVDFFFLLSGFVIGYAYDDRWGKMTVGGFFKRRLIRLHPMIIVGMVVGAITFYFQGNDVVFPNINSTPFWKMLLVFLVGCTLIPLPLSWDIRGWTEMHPLDGPAWTLYFEYIGNILYGLIVRRFSKLMLGALVVIAGAALIHMAVTSPNGDVIGGWALDATQFRVGITRLSYPFFAGLLLSRTARLTRINHAFLWCSLLLLAALFFPRLGGREHLWWNGLYDSLCIILVFPLIVYLGASGELKQGLAARICKFLGEISYPIYIIHYPFIYLFTSWFYNNREFLMSGTTSAYLQLIAGGLAVLGSSITVAYLALKYYDIPVRKWLTQKFLGTAPK